MEFTAVRGDSTRNEYAHAGSQDLFASVQKIGYPSSKIDICTAAIQFEVLACLDFMSLLRSLHRWLACKLSRCHALEMYVEDISFSFTTITKAFCVRLMLKIYEKGQLQFVDLP